MCYSFKVLKSGTFNTFLCTMHTDTYRYTNKNIAFKNKENTEIVTVINHLSTVQELEVMASETPESREVLN